MQIDELMVYLRCAMKWMGMFNLPVWAFGDR